MSIGNRLNLVIEYYNMTHNSFAKSLGMHNGSNIKRLITLNRSPQISTVKKISEAYPNLNMDWLRTGAGKMIIGDKTDIREDDLTVTAKQILKKLDEDRIYYDLTRKEMNEVSFKQMFDKFNDLENRIEAYSLQASSTVNNKLDLLYKKYNSGYVMALNKIIFLETELEDIKTYMAANFELDKMKKEKSKLIKRLNPKD